jgi:peroxiredoxin
VGDPEGTILKGYDVRWPIIGLAKRITYVVGRDRRIKVAFHSEFDIDAHMAKACETLASPAP